MRETKDQTIIRLKREVAELKEAVRGQKRMAKEKIKESKETLIQSQSKSKADLRALDVLAHYAAGCDWRGYCDKLASENECESELFNLEHISTTELKVGDMLQIGWMPNRLCTVEYLGDNRFEATHCENSKMKTGDTFTCLQFTLGKPLIMHDLCQCGDTSHTQTYVAGRQNGLTILKRK